MSNAFISACGWGEPLRIELAPAGGGESSVHTIRHPFAVLGRGPASDLVLEDAEVSRRHAYLQVVAGRLFCTNLQAREGVVWPEGPRSWGWVDRLAGIGIGSFRVRPIGGPEPPPPAADPDNEPLPISRSFPLASPEDAALELLDPGSRATYWRVSRALVLIGRAPSCKVQLVDPRVAGIHASLVRTAGETWVVDLLGEAGVVVNGRRVRYAPLQSGDELHIGSYSLRFHFGPPASGFSQVPAVRSRVAPATGRLPRPTAPPDAGSNPAHETPSVANIQALDPNVRAMLCELGQMQKQMAEMQTQMAEQFQQSLLTMFRLFDGMSREQLGLIRDELEHHRRREEQARGLPRVEPTPSPIETAGRPALRVVTGPDPSSLPPPGPFQETTPAPAAGPKPASAEGAPAPPPDLHAEISRKIAALHDQRRGRWKEIVNKLIGE